MKHAWCHDVARDAAVRAAEDGRTGPLPTLEEAIARAGQFMPPEPTHERKCTERERQAASGGGEGEPVAWREHVEQMLREWWSPSINELGDRATLEQFIGEEGIDSLIDFVCDERKGPSHPPQPRGWLTEIERLMLSNAASTCRSAANSSYRNGDEHEAHVYANEADAIDSLLARSSPPEVVLPEPPFARSNVAYSDWMMCLDAVKNALAAAGVAVKEVGK